MPVPVLVRVRARMPVPVLVRVRARVVVLGRRWFRWWVIRGVVPVLMVGFRRVPVLVLVAGLRCPRLR